VLKIGKGCSESGPRWPSYNLDESVGCTGTDGRAGVGVDRVPKSRRCIEDPLRSCVQNCWPPALSNSTERHVGCARGLQACSALGRFGYAANRWYGAGCVAKPLLGCWRGDVATGPRGGGESVRRWVFFTVDIRPLDKAARLVTRDSDHLGRDWRGVDGSYQFRMCEWDGQREVATIRGRDHGVRDSWFDPGAYRRGRHVRRYLAGTSEHL
jgi:hypothetical protein